MPRDGIYSTAARAEHVSRACIVAQRRAAAGGLVYEPAQQ
jgi:hypothetical protein